jgi:hypothetical protein
MDNEWSPVSDLKNVPTGAWEVKIDDNRTAVVIRYPDSMVLEFSRKEEDAYIATEEYDPARVYPNGQVVFRKDGKLIHRVRISNDAAIAARGLIGKALEVPGLSSVGFWKIQAGWDPGTVDVGNWVEEKSHE